MRDEVQDRYGNIVYLTDERWQHIIDEHPELEAHRSEILKTISSGIRRRDPMALDTFYYLKGFSHLGGELTKIKVVVLFHWRREHPNNFIVTAYPI